MAAFRAILLFGEFLGYVAAGGYLIVSRGGLSMANVPVTMLAGLTVVYVLVATITSKLLA